MLQFLHAVADLMRHICKQHATMLVLYTLHGMQVFEGESIFHCPSSPSPSADVPMTLKKDAAVTVLVQVCCHTLKQALCFLQCLGIKQVRI